MTEEERVNIVEIGRRDDGAWFASLDREVSVWTWRNGGRRYRTRVLWFRPTYPDKLAVFAAARRRLKHVRVV